MTMKEKWSNEQWELSPFNFAPEATTGFNIPKRVIIHDCTLRDGEQQPGVVFRQNEKVELARKLDDLGVQQIEAGMPAVSEEDRVAIRNIVKLGLQAKITALCRITKADIDMALDCDVWGVLCSAPAGYLQLQHKLKWSEEEFMNSALEVSDYAKQHGLYVVLSPYDTTRADLGLITSLAARAAREGKIDRIRVVDTVGSAAPHAIKHLVERIKQVSNVAVEVHCHDDFGMATANTIAGVLGGAEAVSTTINGIGERSGNTPTEEVALALKLLYDVDTGLKLEKIYEVSKFVQEISGVTLQSHKAIVGANSFKQESGLIVGGVVENPFTGQPYAPEVVGRTGEIVLGKKSGRKSIEYKLKQLRMEATAEQIDQLLRVVKEQSIAKKSGVGDEEFKVLAFELIQRSKSKGT